MTGLGPQTLAPVRARVVSDLTVGSRLALRIPIVFSRSLLALQLVQVQTGAAAIVVFT